MVDIPDTLSKLIENFSKLPGIGKRTAERLAIYLIESDQIFIDDFSKNIDDINKKIKCCDNCHCFMEENICSCQTIKSDTICILRKASDVIMIQKTDYIGHYHILGNLISPIDGIGPEALNIDSLMKRIDNIKEIIIATDASVDGDATAAYISDRLKDYQIKITRLARGLPIGGALEHVDQTTLSRSIKDRTELRDD